LEIKPGNQTTEFKLSAWIVSVINVLYAALLAVQSAGLVQLPDVLLGLVTAIVPILTGGVAINYTRSRTAIKVAALNATTGVQLAQATGSIGTAS